MKISKTIAIKLGKKFDINFYVVPFNEWLFGLNVELEHGRINKHTNVSNDRLDITAKIAMAHLEEDPRYYYRLKKMEAQSEKFWAKRNKPSIYN